MGAILVVNAGSRSLKLHVVHDDERVEPLGSLAEAAPAVVAVGHRVVHGGSRLVEPVLIDDAVEAEILSLATLAPLHNVPALDAIDDAQAALPNLPHVAVFDTAFHAMLPEEASTYAVPAKWRVEWGVRRYGFHGLSVQWAAEHVRASRLVVCHLGGGCSVTAVLDGRSVDTTMGFSPLEGVPMATRSGSVDPGAIVYLLREGLLTPDELDHALEYESGLLALGGSTDPRELGGSLALRHYAYRIAGAIASMATALGGLDAIVFTAGVGENSAPVRADICRRLGFLGVELDGGANESARPDADIASASSAVRVVVLKAREEIVIARAVRSLGYG